MLLHVVLLVAINTAHGAYDYKEASKSCGTDRGCVFLPPGCVGNGSCQHGVTWQQTSDGKLRFEFATVISKMNPESTTVWSAIGLSTDTRMDKDTVLECISPPGEAKGVFQVSWNDYVHNEVLRTPADFMTETSVKRDDDDLVCSGVWSHTARHAADAVMLTKIYDLSSDTQFQLLVGRGTCDPITLTKRMHIINDGELFPWATRTGCSFCHGCAYCDLSKNEEDVQQSYPPRKTKHILAISHGVLMMSAWWVCGSTAILAARYLKPSGASCCGSPCWWQLHRPLMTLAFLMASTGILFVYYIDNWSLRGCTIECNTDSYHGYLHGLIGTGVYIAMCVQVLMGMCRPGLNSPSRHVFNYFHWFIGSVTWVAASATICLALPLGKVGLTYAFHHYPKHVFTVAISTFILCAGGCEWYHRFKRSNHVEDGGGEKGEIHEKKGVSCMVAFLILINFFVAALATTIIAWMMLTVFHAIGFSF